jgi:hypothetical protein
VKTLKFSRKVDSVFQLEQGEMKGTSLVQDKIFTREDLAHPVQWARSPRTGPVLRGVSKFRELTIILEKILKFIRGNFEQLFSKKRS